MPESIQSGESRLPGVIELRSASRGSVLEFRIAALSVWDEALAEASRISRVAGLAAAEGELLGAQVEAFREAVKRCEECRRLFNGKASE